MKRDLSQKILDLNGKEFSPAQTLGEVCFVAATGGLPNDTPELKKKLYALAQKINSNIGGWIEFDIDEMKMLMDRIEVMFHVVAMGRSLDLLKTDPVPTAVETTQSAA